MAQEQKQEREVLLVTNEGSDRLEVVSKVDENGALKTVAPAQANEADFFKFDKHSDMLESFLKNYFAQAKNPKHTGLYRVAADGVEGIAEVIKGLLQSGDEGKEYLADCKVDTSKYEQDATHQTEQPKQSGYQQLDESKIDWDAFAKIGITREALEKSSSLAEMLNYRRSSDLHTITMKVDDLTLSTDARLSLRRAEDGRVIPVIHAVRQSPQLDRPFYGVTFTAEDKTNLRKTGNLGRQIEIINKKTGEVIPSYVSVDSKTNELIAYNAKNVRIPAEIKGVALPEDDRAKLLAGEGVYIEGMTSKSGKTFNATLQVNAAERGLTFRFNEPLKQQKKVQQDANAVRIPTKIGGVTITDDNRAALKNGEVIYVEGLTDKKGEQYNAYIKVNNEMGKLDFYKWDPRKKQEQKQEQETPKQDNQQRQQRQKV
ncbi:MAG: DUF3945 domain-containing protein [Rikenellaceae bacterium]